MWFALLGPVEVVADGRPLPLVRAQRRALLAYLLLQAGRTVTAAQLVEALWGGAAPATARTQVQVAVSAIRGVLRAAGADPIHSRPGGYRMTADARTLDLAAFRARMAAADEAPNNEDARRVLRAALDLWRGEPLAGISGAFVDAARTRLEEERLSATERLYDVELRLGRHVDVVAEIAGVALAHPLREKLAGQLMLALYRCGRRIEALSHFRLVRDALVEEFGVEPGPGLRELHRQLLRDDDDTGTEAPVTPNQLPPPVPILVGRDHDLTVVARKLRATRLVGISGIGGVGKTSLAVTAARQARSAYPDGCLFVDLNGAGRDPVPTHAVLGNFLRALGVASAEIPLDGPGRLGLYRTLTAERRLLVVLDNAHGEAQVRPLIPTGAGSATLITSRRVLSTLDGAELVELAPLSDPVSTQLLRRLVAGRTAPDADHDVARLAAHCGGLPLAVRILAARLVEDRTLAPAQLSAALAVSSRPLDEFAAGDLAVGATLRLSYERLGRDAAVLLARLGRLDQNDWTPWTGQALLDRAATGVIRELAALHLVAPVGPTRYRLHDLVRLFAATMPADDRGFARLVRAYLTTAHQAVATLSAGRTLSHLRLDVTSPYTLRFEGHRQSMAWFDAECDNIVATVRQAAATGWHTETWQLAYALRFYFRAAYRVDEWTATNAVALDAASALADLPGQTRIRESIAACLHAQRRYDEQLDQLRLVLTLNRKIGDTIGVARCHDSLGAVLGSLGRLDEAIAQHRLALAVPEYAGDPRNESVGRLNIGTALSQLDRIQEAMGELDAAYRAATEAGDTQVLCFVHHNLAHTHLLLGNHATAQRHAREEIAIAEENGYADRRARGWETLGTSLAPVDPGAADKAWAQAIEYYEELGQSRLADGVRRRRIGDV